MTLYDFMSQNIHKISIYGFDWPVKESRQTVHRSEELNRQTNDRQTRKKSLQYDTKMIMTKRLHI